MNTNFSLFFAGVVAVLLIIIGVQYWHNNTLETSISSKDTIIASLQAANKQFSIDIDARNKAVDKLSEQTRQEIERAQIAMNKAIVIVKQAENMQSELDSMKFKGDECNRTYAAIDAGRVKLK